MIRYLHKRKVVARYNCSESSYSVIGDCLETSGRNVSPPLHVEPLSEPVSVMDATEVNAGASRPPAKKRVINLGHCSGCLNKPVSLTLVVHPLFVPVTVVNTNEGEKSNGKKRKDVHDDGLCRTPPTKRMKNFWPTGVGCSGMSCFMYMELPC